MMAVATLVFWLGRKKFAVVPPAGKAWLKDVFSKEGLSIIARLLLIYLFVAFFWSLWEQSNGQTWVLQAQSDLMDEHISIFGLFSFDVLPAQIQSVNALFILMLVPVFRSEEHTSELQSLMRISYAVFCLKKKNN